MRLTIFYLVFGFIAGIAVCKLFTCTPKPNTVYVHIKDTSESYQPVIDFIEGGRIPDHIDTPKVITKYFEKVVYNDTGKNYVIHDTLSQNKIISRQVFTDFKVPVITQGQRTQLYLGVMAQGNPLTPISGFGPSLMLKTKQDKIFEVGALYGNGQIFYQAGIKFKISFK